MKAAPPSWRVATTRIPASRSPSRRPRKLSPGTVNAYRTPAGRRASGRHRPTVRGAAGARGSDPSDVPRAAGRGFRFGLDLRLGGLWLGLRLNLWLGRRLNLGLR